MRRGAVAGALAGVWLAFSDYGALWLWLPSPRDRLWLLLRLLACLIPVAALAGALASWLGVALSRAVERRPARWAGVLTVLVSGPAVWLSVQLCSGGMMSRLWDSYPSLQPALWVALLILAFAALLAGFVSSQSLAHAREPARTRTALALLLASALLAKANQTILPNLYDYLHVCLALLTFGTAALGFGLGLFWSWRLAGVRRVVDNGRFASALALVALAVGAANVRTLDDNLNVRVALFDARSPTSRALLSAFDPWLRQLEQRNQPAHKTYAPRPTASLPAIAPGAHVVLITIDALRADHLGSYGYARPVSPKLDAFAQEAVQFERAYAQAPHSSYSLSSLHTSAYLHEVVELGLPLPEATLARALSAHGYHTAAFYTSGIFHTEGEKLASLRDSAFGFKLFDHTDRESEQQTERVLAEVERIKQRGEPPSLLWVHYFDVHEPYQETTFGSGEMDRYDSEILHVDREVDRLIRELDARLERDVVIAITADHGEEFRDHGGVYHGSTLYDEQVRVPLILRAPGLAPAHVAAPVESIDVAPTLLSIVGAPVPTSMRGRDLRAPPPPAVYSAVLTKRMALRWPHKLIADLRFGLYELYDLASDPDERKNLAGSDEATLSELRGMVYGWLDAIDDQHGDDLAYERALNLGRLGDRRAVEPLSALLLDASALARLRVEAGQNLAKLADPSSVPALLEGLQTQPPEVAAEAAIALGRLYDERAREALRKLMHVEDPHLRARAAVSLGRLRDRAAVPALIDALWVAPTQYEREEAVRWLGRLGDPRAIEPLLSLLGEFSLRYLLAVALGQVGGMSGDTRAYTDLVGMLEWESRTNIRDEVVRGLGLMKDARAVPALVRLFEQDAALKNTTESLVRLQALERGAIGGVDASARLAGFAHCEAAPYFQDWEYLGRTQCTSTSARVQLSLPLPVSHRSWDFGAQLALRARSTEPVQCELALGELHTTVALEAELREQRVELAASQLSGTIPLTLRCPDEAHITLDHALVIPRSEAHATR
ncbi:MAG TPA: sulfatase-like hydrolase/transferase [Polyangiales bacterium]|nr:sulfatase-like hydrolase/transferase [Polyangiales bacterium]